MMLRIKTRGSFYEFVYICPKCGSQTAQRLDLGALEVTSLGEYDNKVQLDKNLTVELSLITRRMQKAASHSVNKEQTDVEAALDSRLLTYGHAIKKLYTPDGEYELTPEEGYAFINEIPRGLYEKVQQWFNDKKFGVKFVFKTKCGKCKHKEEGEIPLDNFLF